MECTYYGDGPEKLLASNLESGISVCHGTEQLMLLTRPRSLAVDCITVRVECFDSGQKHHFSKQLQYLLLDVGHKHD